MLEWLRVLEKRELELMEFIERPYIESSPDLWFYQETLGNNKGLQMIVREILNR